VPVPERASNTGDRDGTGVELALSARIVDRHGGEIEVDSTEGEGSTVSFTLPAA
jgi:signal transduction histidine kinase